MTTIRDRILAFVASFTKKHGYGPSVREIGKAVGLSSTSSVWNQIERLQGEGRLLATPRIARSYRVAS